MPPQILPVSGLDTVGLIKDQPPSSLPPQAFSDCRNVRFRDGAVLKMEGDVNIFPNLGGGDSDAFIDSDAEIKYVAWWPNPNLVLENSGYYLIIAQMEDTDENRQRDFAYIVRPGGTPVLKGKFERAAQGAWQHTFFQGGFSLIINNGIDTPHYILDDEGNTDIDMVPDFHVLPGWQNYRSNQVLLEDTFNDSDQRLFDFGQIVDFTSSTIVVEKIVTNTDGSMTESEVPILAGNPAGTGTPNDSDFMPGILPSGERDAADGYEVYLDTETNTHVMWLGTEVINVRDTIRVRLRSRERIHVRAGVIRSFGDFLVAANIVEVEETDPDVIVRRLPGVVKASDVAAPGAVPNNWNPYAAGVSTASEFQTTQGGVVQDMVELQGNLYVYANDSIYFFRNPNGRIPDQPQSVAQGWGALTTDAIVEFDGQHVVVGAQDIYIFGGHPGNIQSIADGRVREYFYQNLNPLHQQRLFMLRHIQKDEIWIVYPTKESITGQCDEALIWNYRKNNWTIRDINGAVAGDVGPIPGGGIPVQSIHLQGESGDSGISQLGAYDIQTIVIDSDGGLEGDDLVGLPTIYTVTSTLPPGGYTARGSLIFDFNFPQPFNSGTTNPLHFYAVGRNADGDIVFEYEEQLGANLINANQVAIDLEFHAGFRAHMNAVAPPGHGDTELVIRFLDTDIVTGAVSFGSELSSARNSARRRMDRDINSLPGITGDSDCTLNATFYVSQHDLGLDYFFNVPGYNPLPAGSMFEILGRIGDGDTEFMYDAGRDGVDTDSELMYATGLTNLAIDQHPRGFPTQRPFSSRDTDTATGPIFMYRYRPDSARSHVQHNEPWRPNEIGLYHARFTIPKGSAICPVDFQLDAYDPPTPSDGTPVTGLLDPFRQNTPVDTNGVSTAPVVTFDSWEERYLRTTGYTRQAATQRTIHIALGGVYDSDSDRLLAEHISNIFHDQPADSYFTGTDSDNVSTLTSQYSGRFELFLRDVLTNPHGVTSSNFRYERTQVGLWPTVSIVTDATRQSQLIYPTVAISMPSQVAHQTSVGYDTEVQLVNPNTDKQTDISTRQVIQQLKRPITDSTSWLSYDPGDARIPLEIRGIKDSDQWITVWSDSQRYAPVRNQWSVTVMSYGNSRVGNAPISDTNWTPQFTNMYNATAAIHGVDTDITRDFRGGWQQQSTPTYLALLVSNGTDPINYPDGLELVIVEAGERGDYNALNQIQRGTNGIRLNNEPTAEKWIDDIRLINPRLSVIDRGTDGQFIIQPANYSDASQFVLASAMNDTPEGTAQLNEWYLDTETIVDTDTMATRKVVLNPNSVRPLRNINRITGILDRVAEATYSPTAVQDTDYTQFVPGTRVPNLMKLDSDANLRNIIVQGPDAKVFDIDRPWGTNEVNYNINVPILATFNILGQDFRNNKVLASDIGWTRPLDTELPRVDSFPGIGVNRVITGDDQPTSYRSYATRLELPITPEFETEQVQSIAILADGFYKPGFFDSDVYNRLVVNAYGTNAPGERFMNTDRQISNVYYLTEDYKIDIRTQGRFINVEVGDAMVPHDTDVTILTQYEGKDYTQNANWRVNGLQLEIMKGGQR